MDPGKNLGDISFIFRHLSSERTRNELNENFKCCQTNNILAPIITHGIYSAVILGHGLWKIHDHRRRLHQRIQQLKQEGKSSGKF